ncbi:MAG: CinA family protein [Lachnospiraceae bacterium]|nr:CinA family protein [Lachnospiraceae bacterium]
MKAKHALERQVVSLLKERHMKISFAESCTGGLLSGRLVNVPGSSEVYEEGYVTYSNEAKYRLLGVDRQTLGSYGAVSKQVAMQMAQGAAKRSGAQAAVGITGVAGPGGGTPNKPVGLVYIGCYMEGNMTVTENYFSGSRGEVRKQAVEAALELLVECLT